MKLLYNTPESVHYDFQNPDTSKQFEFQEVTNFIRQSIERIFDSIEIVQVSDLLINCEPITPEVIEQFDLLLCDLTACNPNIAYLTGIADALRKPIIYIVAHNSDTPVCIADRRMLMYSDATLKSDFIQEVIGSLKLAIEDPGKFVSSKNRDKPKSPKVFISYSHMDRKYLERLMIHLKPLSKIGRLDIWVDTKIKTGDKWREEIEKALGEASIAILLISADFMASDFIVENELPPLLTKAEVKGTKILPIIVSPCRFSRESGLNCFQAVNEPTDPLSLMEEEKREHYYDALASDIEVAIQA